MIGPPLEEYVRSFDARPLIVVVLAPGADVVAHREAQRAKVADRAGAHEIVELDHVLRHDTPRIGMWLDSSDQTPEQTVDEIIGRGDESTSEEVAGAGGALVELVDPGCVTSLRDDLEPRVGKAV